MDGSGVEGAIEDSGELLKDCTPCIGMEFDSESAAFGFYNEFGRIRGFSIRKDYATKSRTDGMIINRKYVCSKEGVKDYRSLTKTQTKRETRTNCGALMYISLDRASLKWSVTKFDDTHNHDLHTPDTVHMMRTQRGLCESQALNAEIAESTGLRLKLSHDLISAQSGGKEFVGFMREDLKTHLRSRRERDLQYGEAGILIKYFQKKAMDNPYFFHTMQLDMDEMITNIFWADHQMITDYGLFGDTLSFDTTFRTNKECRPLALFTGFNHHCMTVIFGVALMYDETTPSFVWLFQTFLEAMSGKKPLTFFTDQDQAMANALFGVMPDVKHGLCTFHLNQNAMKHLGYLGENFSAFINDFNACMYGYEEKSELIEAWTALVKNYKLEDNAWVKKTWELQEKWAHVHMKWSFNEGMRSTQLSESLNAQIKRHLKSDNNLGLFFTFFDQAVLEKRYKEIQAKFDSREKMVQIKFRSCPMLLHVAKFYTPNLFDLFHKQFDISLACKVMETRELGDEIGFVVQRHGQERKYVVMGRVELDALGAKTLTEVSCSCRKFESFGILCGHAIKVLSQMNVMEIPEKYILGRWRLDAKSCSSKGKEVMVEDNDRKLVISARYRHLCPKVVTLVAQASEDDEAYRLVEDTITLLCAQVDNIFLSKRGFGASSSGPESPAIEVGGGFDFIDPNLKKAKGLKKKVKVTNRGIKGSKRQKAWHEKVTKRGKSIPRSRFSQGVEVSNTEIPLPNLSSNQSTDGETLYYPQMTHLQSQASCSTQVSEVPYEESIHIPMEAESLFRDEEFLEALVNSNLSNSQY